jgi:dsDNA-binding SOS-regulon protein
MKTVNELIEKWKETVERNQGYTQSLWLGTAKHIVHILENNPPEAARAELRKLRRTYRKMAISMWYAGAADELTRIIRNQKRKAGES